MHNTKIQKAYLVDYETTEVKEFQYNPAEWTDSRTVSYAAHNVLGISHPVYQFVNGGERIIKFAIYLNAMYDKNAMDVSHWIRARTYPSRKGGYNLTNAPHRVVFIWPNAARVLGIITQADRRIIDHFPDGRIKLMTMEIEIKEYITKSFTFEEVR